MLTAACPHCRRRYQVRAEIVPARGTRARCPHCGAVFSIVPSVTESASNGGGFTDGAEITPAPTPVNGSGRGGEDSLAELGDAEGQTGVVNGCAPIADSGLAWGEELEQARPERGVFGEVRPRMPGTELGSSPATASPEPAMSETPREHARSLARALASDLLEYHADACRLGIRETRLIELLGRQVARSWDMYVEEMGPEFAQDTDIFQQAFNEILTDGRKYF